MGPVTQTWQRTGSELRGMFGRREISVREAVAQQLARIEDADGALHSLVSIDADGAYEQADALDARCAAGNQLGPLHGLTVVIKDNIDVAGWPTRMGSALFDDAPPATEDSDIVARLRRSGAVVVAKSSTHELAAGISTPGTNNPWDSARSVGGSSGGSAAAVAASLATFGIGTDVLGSVRLPAAYCGVVGLKPTFGRLPNTGSRPLAWSLDHIGLFARTVEDTELLLYGLEAAKPRRVERRRTLGIPRQLLTGIDADAQGAVDRAVSLLEAADYRVMVIDIPDLRYALGCAYALVLAEAGTIHRRTVADGGHALSDDLRSVLQAGQGLPAVTYLIAQQVRRHLADVVRGAFEAHDLLALLVPATHGAAHHHGQTHTGTGAEPIAIGALRPSVPFNLTGQPSLAVPVMMNADSLPISVQLVARPDDEVTTFELAAVLDTAASALHDRRRQRCGEPST